ncbi:late endosomal/lysosomal adaptor, MAPK and MTOR activator 4 isoform X1 [Tachypleus tridentatus]|uniref:late endosomal/lysosomal adaptor, MAPK and MTOR activator 4 isoform X1 n=2 Tax=Tachypleus tridentatus TaxID=6853 RepID=UPI003FD4D90F
MKKKVSPHLPRFLVSPITNRWRKYLKHETSCEKIKVKPDVYIFLVLCDSKDTRSSKCSGFLCARRTRFLKMTFTGSEVPQQTGYLVLNEDGGVVSSGGDLANDEHAASVVINMLNLIEKSTILPTENKELFKRLSIQYDDHLYIIMVSNKKIHVVKRNYVPAEPVEV